MEKQLTEQELYEQELQENPPKKVRKLQLRPGELVLSGLNDDDKYQVFIRYMNDICSISKSNLQIIADLYVLIEFICEKMGIDVRAKKHELAKKIKEQMDKNIADGKKELENASKKA